MQMAVGVQPHPELRRHLEQPGEAVGRVSGNVTPEHDLVQPVRRDFKAAGWRE